MDKINTDDYKIELLINSESELISILMIVMTLNLDLVVESSSQPCYSYKLSDKHKLIDSIFKHFIVVNSTYLSYIACIFSMFAVP